MKALIFSLIITLTMISCNENAVENKVEEYGIPYGSWVITSNMPTMGPVCIFIEVNDTVRFIENPLDTSKFIFQFKSLDVVYNDVYDFEFSDNQYFCYGMYSFKMMDNKYNLIDTTLPQKMFIKFSNTNEINCRIAHSSPDFFADTLTFGDVSNFWARRVK